MPRATVARPGGVLIEIELPLPPPTNHAYKIAIRRMRDKKTRLVRQRAVEMLTDEGAAYKTVVNDICRAKGLEIPSGPLQIEYWFYLPARSYAQSDVDGRLKLIQDAIFDGSHTVANDNKIVDLIAHKRRAEAGDKAGYAWVRITTAAIVESE